MSALPWFGAVGRPKKLNTTQLMHARKLINEGTSRNEVARILDINPSTLYRNLQKPSRKASLDA
jgi:DNA invertase Pin-like site-specific DNA recombinase